MTTPPLPPNHEPLPREFLEKYGAPTGSLFYLDGRWVTPPKFATGAQLTQQELEWFWCAPTGTIASVTTPLPEARCECGYVTHGTDWSDCCTESCPAHPRNALVRILPGRLAGLGKKPEGLMWINTEAPNPRWLLSDARIEELQRPGFFTGKCAYAVPQWSMDEIEAGERDRAMRRTPLVVENVNAAIDRAMTIQHLQREKLNMGSRTLEVSEAEISALSTQPESEVKPCATSNQEPALQPMSAHVGTNTVPSTEPPVASNASGAGPIPASAGRPTDGELLNQLEKWIGEHRSVSIRVDWKGRIYIVGMVVPTSKNGLPFYAESLRAAIAYAMKGDK